MAVAGATCVRGRAPRARSSASWPTEGRAWLIESRARDERHVKFLDIWPSGVYG